MSNDVTMTTGRLSVQPGFGVFRRAAGSTLTVWVFNLLSGRKQATVPDGIMGGWAVVVASFGGGEEREYKLRHHLNLCLIAQMEMKMKKVVGVLFFPFFFTVLLPSRSSNGQLQRHERDKQINT